jgi:hypothetical protein
MRQLSNFYDLVRLMRKVRGPRAANLAVPSATVKRTSAPVAVQAVVKPPETPTSTKVKMA